MSFSSNLQVVALRLLTNYGQLATFTHVVDNYYDPDSGSAVQSSTTWSAHVYPDSYVSNEIDAVNVLVTDSKLYIHSGNVPQINDIVVFNSTSYRLLAVQKITAQGNDIIYVAQARV